ncbi:hypothetical protein DM860_014480 [Cuscuta australis]|uniref:Uncharacterized protein n=1 Tax=Cuscuta australis TaxID=267555 RepID=A0A328E183_9ASTE|nr:hypothetical protein DM860_014480 [Cuscuta australis]
MNCLIASEKLNSWRDPATVASGYSWNEDAIEPLKIWLKIPCMNTENVEREERRSVLILQRRIAADKEITIVGWKIQKCPEDK